MLFFLCHHFSVHFSSMWHVASWCQFFASSLCFWMIFNGVYVSIFLSIYLSFLLSIYLTSVLLYSGLCCYCCGAFWFSLFTFCCRAVVRWAAARFPLPRGPALQGEAAASCLRPLQSHAHMSPTPPRSASLAMAPQGQVACVHPLHDTSPLQTMTEATTTDPRHATPLPTTGALHPGMVRHAPLGTSPHARPSTAHPGRLTEAAGAGLHPGTAWSVTGPSTREIMSMSVTTSLPPTSRASPTATLTHMEEILTHTHVHLGLPATGLLHPLNRIHAGYPMVTAHLHLPHTDGEHQGCHPTHTTGLPMPEGPARACMNLIVRRMRMTGASNHKELGIWQERRRRTAVSSALALDM